MARRHEAGSGDRGSELRQSPPTAVGGDRYAAADAEPVSERTRPRRPQSAGFALATGIASRASLISHPLSLSAHHASLVLLSALCLFLSGCRDGIETAYGQRSGVDAALSVNGTSVLAGMFEQAGHRVFSRYALSPALSERADCIVWFPDDFKPPPEPVREWLEKWLADRSGRTLIYVGRDFDAASFYWKTIQAGAPQDQADEIKRRLNVAQLDYQSARKNLPADERCDWFTYDNKQPMREVRTLQGDPEWLEGIDPAQLEIELRCRFVPGQDMDVLLESEGDALMTTQQSDGSQLIVVTNGSFLLNVPLVNHEHRKLAGKLIRQVGTPGKTVVFLESGSGGPTIRKDDVSETPPTGLEIFNIWPTNWILLHLLVVGIVFCFSRYPIFGRAREPQADGRADFGTHVQALAELFEKTRDAGYAMSRVLHYQQKVHPGAGKAGDRPVLPERPAEAVSSQESAAASPAPTSPFSPGTLPRKDEP